MNDKLYQEIEQLIILWSNDGTKTAGYLTRQIVEALNKNDETEWCHYSDMPSPQAYMNYIDEKDKNVNK